MIWKKVSANAHRALRTKSGSHNEVIGNKFRHPIVNTSQTPYERSISRTTALSISLSKPGYRFLGHLPGLPETNLSFKPLLALHKAADPPQSMMRYPRKCRLDQTLQVLCPSSSGSTLRVKNRPRHQKRP
ncbi:hypothetical protein M9H77_07841 [Catharanthus roseus]|uniref:Uncharacterized protein n=1 Tax=Catharanthus roseus TaxID=4058 RepID=A0ACC0BW41_CATRO|nr:hypothetical protein M9H77_07841 [Catharanthus roseus]